MYRPDRLSEESIKRQTTSRAVFLLCALSLLLLACGINNILASADATATPGRTRIARRPTFTPRPVNTDTPEPTLTPEPSATPPPTDEPPTEVPTRRPTARPRPTDTPLPPPTTVPPTSTPLPTATIVFQYQPSDQSCNGDENATNDTVRGTIKANDKGAVGQRVRGSAGPGGEPISDNDAQSGPNGGYKVTFQCANNTACNGDFWIWMVNAEGHQISPYIKFSFNDGCRRGVVNFTKQ